MSAQYSAFAKTEEARKCREKLEDSEERVEVAQIAASKERDEAQTAEEEASWFEADYGTEVECRREKVCMVRKQFHLLVASAAAGLKELAVVHALLESHKAKANF